MHAGIEHRPADPADGGLAHAGVSLGQFVEQQRRDGAGVGEQAVGRGVERGLVGGDAQARAQMPLSAWKLMPSASPDGGDKVLLFLRAPIGRMRDLPGAAPQARGGQLRDRLGPFLARFRLAPARVERLAQQRHGVGHRARGLALRVAAQFGVQLRVRARQPRLALAAQFGDRLVQAAARACARLRQRAARLAAPRRR